MIFILKISSLIQHNGSLESRYKISLLHVGLGGERLWLRNLCNRPRFCTKPKYLEPKQKEQFGELT